MILTVRILIGLVLLLLLAAGLLFRRPRHWMCSTPFPPGGGDVERIVAGVSFTPEAALKLDVWRLGARAAGPLPVLIFFYGGAWVKGQRQDYGFVARVHAARVYVVVIPDYRKVPSVHFPNYIEDGAAAVRWVHDNIEKYGGDPEQIILAGHSAGGYIAMMLALDRHYLDDAGLPTSAVRAVECHRSC